MEPKVAEWKKCSLPRRSGTGPRLIAILFQISVPACSCQPVDKQCVSFSGIRIIRVGSSESGSKASEHCEEVKQGGEEEEEGFHRSRHPSPLPALRGLGGQRIGSLLRRLRRSQTGQTALQESQGQLDAAWRWEAEKWVDSPIYAPLTHQCVSNLMDPFLRPNWRICMARSRHLVLCSMYRSRGRC